MSNIHRLEDWRNGMGRNLRDGGEPPYGGDGGGGMDDMVRQLDKDVSYIKGKLEDMPTKDWVTTRLIWVVLAVGAIGALIEAGGSLIP